MFHKRKKMLPGVLIGRLFSLLMLFVIIAGFNYFNERSGDYYLNAVTLFLNSNLLLLVLISLVLMVSDVFWDLPFPVNLPAPIISAAAAVMIVAFIFHIFGLIQDLALQNVFDALAPLALLIYIIVFLVVLAGGYLKIVVDLFRCDDEPCCGKWGEKEGEKKEEIPQPQETKDNPTWSDVGKEFRATIYDALVSARKSMKEEERK